MDLRTVQTELKALGLYTDKVDGDYGPNTDRAVEAFLLNQKVDGYKAWPNKRQGNAAMQALARLRGIEVGTIDGLIGPQSRHAFEIYDARAKNGWKPVAEVEQWRDKPQPAVPSAPLPRLTSKLKPPPIPFGGTWPKQSEMTSKFGAPGSNQTTLVFPFAKRLAWDTDTKVVRASCHKLCKEHFEFVWEHALAVYGLAEIQRLRLDLWGGLLNVRRMRGGTSWSMHSWGVAEDTDPDHNQLKWGRDKASLDNPEYDQFWSGVEAVGGVSLGRARNYDWMHYQFARL